jgi:hypothetical protein
MVKLLLLLLHLLSINWLTESICDHNTNAQAPEEKGILVEEN